MYKVFIENQLLIFTNENNIQKNKSFFESTLFHSVQDLLKKVGTETIEIQLIVEKNNTINSEVDRLFKSFKKIDAAGGIVLKDTRILVIFRNGKWDLAKGHVDEGESFQNAAIREVEEECGVRATLKSKIGTTQHTYVYEDQLILKTTHWYEMECIDDSDMQPQFEEGISVIEWLEMSQLDSFFKNTYTSIASLLKSYLAMRK
ncbi:MAG: NUDIX domain-containing protein [Crocinitomicaceae bacterium]|nr:NUDIX domain-containing protein [Crocinitomicaceae bacterium]